MNATEECIDVCNSLLRGELSAITTYSQAMEKFETDPAYATLGKIRSDHESSAMELRTHLNHMGAEAVSDAGAWGEFAKAVEGGAKLLGKSPALAALQQGEKHGISEYEQALGSPEVMEEIRSVIRQRLLPPLRQHIEELENLRERT